MREKDRTIDCLGRIVPAALEEHYVRQLILVASHGDDWARRRFLHAHRRSLGGYTGYLLHFSDEHLQAVFADALAAQRGSWPETLLGFRLAVPIRASRRRPEIWSLWQELADYHPRGIAVDPICGMFVDPHTARCVVRDGTRTVYFCCPRCLAAYVPSSPDVTEIRRLPIAPTRWLAPTA